MGTNVSEMLKISLKMNVLLFSLVICVIAAPYNDAVDLDMYPDLPEEYFIEQLLANRLHTNQQLTDRLQASDQLTNRLQASDLQAEETADVYPEIKYAEESDVVEEPTLPDFTYHYPPGAEHEESEFAVKPPDPRYYHDTRHQLVSENTDEVLKPSVRQSLDDDTFDPPRPVKSITSSTSLPTAVDRDVDQQLTQPADEFSLVENSGTHAQMVQTPVFQADDKQDVYFIAIVAGCSAAAAVLVVAITISWYKLQRNAMAAADVEYPAYGVTGPNKETSPTGDRKLAQSAQMYHYQHQKQQIIAMENRVASERNGSMSEVESDEENEEGDYTVYECPGLAPTGEMEVKNPLFHDDPTPATPAPANQNTGSTCSPVDQTNNKK